jgi:hypothetical protein
MTIDAHNSHFTKKTNSRKHSKSFSHAQFLYGHRTLNVRYFTLADCVCRRSRWSSFVVCLRFSLATVDRSYCVSLMNCPACIDQQSYSRFRLISRSMLTTVRLNGPGAKYQPFDANRWLSFTALYPLHVSSRGKRVCKSKFP